MNPKNRNPALALASEETGLKSNSVAAFDSERVSAQTVKLQARKLAIQFRLSLDHALVISGLFYGECGDER